MYAVVGASGNTGGATARALARRGVRVRVIVRDPAKGENWRERRADVAVADLEDDSSLARAFRGAKAAYVLNPPAYAAEDMFAVAERLARNILSAARQANLPRLVVLSSIGAQLMSGHGNIRTNSTFERVLGELGPIAVFLRPAYFMENWAWVADAAVNEGVLPSFLSPPERAIPMISVLDVGRAAAEAMVDGAGARIVEISGPRDFSPADAAAAFSHCLGRPVAAVAVPRENWPAELTRSGFSARTIDSWVELFDAFNSGHVVFEGPAPRRERVDIEEAVRAILSRR